MRCATCASGAPSLTLNCGYGHGFSVLDVIEAVKRVSGVDFKVDIAPRRPGDPAQIVAQSERVRSKLGWQPRYDDLSTIVRDALDLGTRTDDARDRANRPAGQGRKAAI